MVIKVVRREPLVPEITDLNDYQFVQMAPMKNLR
jgi:hypothetical protein